MWTARCTEPKDRGRKVFVWHGMLAASVLAYLLLLYCCMYTYKDLLAFSNGVYLHAKRSMKLISSLWLVKCQAPTSGWSKTASCCVHARACENAFHRTCTWTIQGKCHAYYGNPQHLPRSLYRCSWWGMVLVMESHVNACLKWQAPLTGSLSAGSKHALCVTVSSKHTTFARSAQFYSLHQPHSYTCHRDDDIHIHTYMHTHTWALLHSLWP